MLTCGWRINQGSSASAANARLRPSLSGLLASRFRLRSATKTAREATWTKYAERFPRLRDWLTNFESALSGMLGRVFLVKLTGGSQVYAHDDKGSYYESRDRFHVVLSTSEALQMRCDGLQQELKTGDIAWFDNQREYELENPTNSDAVYLIVDLLPCPPRPRPSSKHKHFELVHAVVPLDDMITELQRGQDLWEWDTSRQERIRVQRETNSIPLRGAMKPTPPGILTRDVHPAIDTAMAPCFPLLYVWVAEFAKSVRGEVSRLAVVRLNPNGTVHEHIDEGEYYLSRDRYHLVLISPDGSPMQCGDEELKFREGELWWFDNKATHMAFNNSDVGRVHVIFDVKPRRDYAKTPPWEQPCSDVAVNFAPNPPPVERAKPLAVPQSPGEIEELACTVRNIVAGKAGNAALPNPLGCLTYLGFRRAGVLQQGTWVNANQDLTDALCSLPKKGELSRCDGLEVFVVTRQEPPITVLEASELDQRLGNWQAG